MCEKKQRSKKKRQSSGTALSLHARKHIWEVSPSLHCSILGTCLSFSDLSNVVRRGIVRFPNGATDYEIHGTFVELMETRNPASKMVDKILEKKYRVIGLRFRKADSVEALLAAWEDAWQRNEIPGAYWCVVSHPLFNMDIRRRVFGEVHMLSHLLGASRRTDIRKLQALDKQYATLQGKMALVKTVFRKRLKARDSVIAEMQYKLSTLKNVERQLALAHETIFKLRRNSGVDALESEIAALKAAMRTASTRASLAESSLADMKKTAESGAVINAKALERIHSLSEENAALEEELRSVLVCSEKKPECGALIENNGVNLCGRKIMYVGGRSNLVRYYRALVERRGGEFIYHDGGIENSMEMLKNAMNGADAVLCPIDCVSHNACLSVKQACKHMAKPFIPIRSSGLSSLAHGMQAIA